MIILLCRYCKSKDIRITGSRALSDFQCKSCGRYLKLYEAVFAEVSSESSIPSTVINVPQESIDTHSLINS